MAFLISTFQLQQFPRYQGVPNLHQGPCPPGRSLAEKIFIPKASTLSYVIVFLISTFQVLYFPRYQGVPNLRQGTLCPIDAPQQKNFSTQGEYFGISNGVFNINYFALLVSEILGGPKFTLRVLLLTGRRIGKILVP